MAISTYITQLMKGVTVGNVTTWTKLCDIKDFPDLGGAPELLETTTQSDGSQTFINGIQSMSAMEFTLNYDADVFDTINALSAGTTNKFAMWFGLNGVDGRFTFDGDIAIWVVGSGVNTVVDMKISIAPSTVIVKEPSIDLLTLVSTAGASVGTTDVAVAPALTGANTYVYKTALLVTAPLYHDVCTTGWTAWTEGDDITATTGHEIVVVEIDADDMAIKTGKTIVVSLEE